jgi:hypothetical protein
MENASAIIKQIQQYTDEPPEMVISQLVGFWANWQSFVRSIVPESSAELPDRVEAMERKFNHLLLQTDQKCAETLQRVAEGERTTGAALQRIKEQFEKLFGGLSDRVSMAEIKIAGMATIGQMAEIPETPAIQGSASTNHTPKPTKTKVKQIDLDALNLAQLRQLLTPNGLPQRIAPGSRYRNRNECLEVLGQLQDAGRLKSKA